MVPSDISVCVRLHHSDVRVFSQCQSLSAAPALSASHLLCCACLVQLSPYAFTPAHSKVLSKQLMRISVPGLNSLDQMYLVAMADTVAHCKMDFADCFTESKDGA